MFFKNHCNAFLQAPECQKKNAPKTPPWNESRRFFRFFYKRRQKKRQQKFLSLQLFLLTTPRVASLITPFFWPDHIESSVR